jgi:hypothetical protein
MVDYSKWNDIDYDSDDDVKPVKPSLAGPGVSPEFAQKLLQMKNDPGALENLNKELDEMKMLAERAKAEQFNARTKGVSPSDTMKENLTKKRTVLEQKLAAMEEEKRKMDEQFNRLNQLASMGDPQSILQFFESQGMDRDSIQKMMGGSDAETNEVLFFFHEDCICV